MDAIFRELGRLQHEPECADLLQFRSLVTAHQYRGLVALLRRHVPVGARVLDWGCGNGHFSYTLLALGYRASGYSFHDFGLRRHLPASYEFTQGTGADPAALPYPDASFDAVTSVGVLEHVRETGGTEEGSLREIARVLRPGGAFVCYHFPNRYSWVEAVARRVPGAHQHRYRYTAGDIRRLCEGAGLSCVEITRYGALPRNLWHRAPRALRDSALVARAWDLLDAALAVPFRALTQNYAFVAVNGGVPPERSLQA
ncbi:MAG: class I SAM-dependent methyltransferase [Minisyncoccota bacterium]